MARPPRIRFENAWYHAMNRGAGRQLIFKTDAHREQFLQQLAEAVKRYSVEVHAYCLMSNHFHLLLRTPTDGLSEAMKYLQGTYTRHFNRSVRRDGPLFRSRFKAVIIDADAYLLDVSRYIHNNPVEAKIVEQPQQFPWSSYAAYSGRSAKPNWLQTEEILKPVNDYKTFVENPRYPSMRDFYDSRHLPGVLGSKQFRHYVSSLGFESRNRHPDSNDHTTMHRLCERIATVYEQRIEDLLESVQGKANPARTLSICLVRKHTNLTLSDIAKQFGVSPSNIAAIVSRNSKLLEKRENTHIVGLLERELATYNA